MYKFFFEERMPVDAAAGLRVFLVEDGKQTRKVMAALLSTIGDFTVVGSAGTEAEANLWLKENDEGWDLAIVDLVLEEGTGLGVLPRTRSRLPGSRVVVFSDFVTPGTRNHCVALGADAVFHKSGELSAFIQYCSNLAREPHGQT
jgi:DNA-binding NarL/FixJ family response regulator